MAEQSQETKKKKLQAHTHKEALIDALDFGITLNLACPAIY